MTAVHPGPDDHSLAVDLDLPGGARGCGENPRLGYHTEQNGRMGGCRYAYDLPGIDLSFFHGSFLGISANLQAVVFDTFGYHGIDKIEAIVNSLVNELPDKEPGLWPTKVLREVSDPDPFGARYTLEETPGCPNCG